MSTVKFATGTEFAILDKNRGILLRYYYPVADCTIEIQFSSTEEAELTFHKCITDVDSVDINNAFNMYQLGKKYKGKRGLK